MDGCIQGCTAQAAADQQVLVAPGLTAQGREQHQLAPLLAALETAAGRLPAKLSAAAGSCSKRHLQTLEDRALRGSRATGPPRRTTCARLGRTACGRGGRRSRCRLRQTAIEPVCGQIQQARGCRQVSLRGLEQARQAGALVCIARNLGKLAAAQA